MKKDFTTGLTILLPILLTLVILGFLINFLTEPFLAITMILLQKITFLQSYTALLIVSKILILIFLTAFVVVIGFLGQLFLFNRLLKFGDYFLHKIPLINPIYKTSQEVVHTLFSSSSTSYSQVVLAPYPSATSRSIGLATTDELELKNSDHPFPKLIPVFIPQSPNPSGGYVLFFEKKQLLFTDMTAEEALKITFSCGAVKDDFTINMKQFHDKSTAS